MSSENTQVTNALQNIQDKVDSQLLVMHSLDKKLELSINQQNNLSERFSEHRQKHDDDIRATIRKQEELEAKLHEHQRRLDQAEGANKTTAVLGGSGFIGSGLTLLYHLWLWLSSSLPPPPQP